jgi:rhodanese-related sulfurtransferase
MTHVIDRTEVRRLLEHEAAQLVEVLPREEFDSVHIPGATNLPLQDLSAESAHRLDPAQPVIVYCHDFQ